MTFLLLQCCKICVWLLLTDRWMDKDPFMLVIRNFSAARPVYPSLELTHTIQIDHYFLVHRLFSPYTVGSNSRTLTSLTSWTTAGDDRLHFVLALGCEFSLCSKYVESDVGSTPIEVKTWLNSVVCLVFSGWFFISRPSNGFIGQAWKIVLITIIKWSSHKSRITRHHFPWGTWEQVSVVTEAD